MQLQNTALTVRAGQTKPHMQRDALPKAHPQTMMGNLKNSAGRATQGKPRQTVITGAGREWRGSLCRFFLENSPYQRLPFISAVTSSLNLLNCLDQIKRS